MTPERVGNLDPIVPKRCRCGARGEWPGQPCPECRLAALKAAEEPSV